MRRIGTPYWRLAFAVTYSWGIVLVVASGIRGYEPRTDYNIIIPDNWFGP